MQQIEVRRERDADAARRVGGPEATVTLTEDGATVGRASIAAGNDSVTLGVDVADDTDLQQRRERTVTLLTATLEAVAAEGGGVVHWWVPAATAADEETAGAIGMVPGRALLQMRRPLPTGLPVEVSTRAFRPGIDEEEWVAVNNRAFAGHPEQGGWTVDTLRSREAEPWFDPAGFRLHERDGRLAAFCWTKLHKPGTEDAERVGEIYVIGVDPDFQGLGLGRQLTLAGLDSIAGRDVTLAMLYVDAANAAAVGMYEGLGFTLHRTDRAFTTNVPARDDGR